MNKLKLFLATTLVAGIACVGALASTPTASAQPRGGVCQGYFDQSNLLWRVGMSYFYGGNFFLAEYYLDRSDRLWDAGNECLRGL